jgi:hypothetical protein
MLLIHINQPNQPTRMDYTQDRCSTARGIGDVNYRAWRFCSNESNHPKSNNFASSCHKLNCSGVICLRNCVASMDYKTRKIGPVWFLQLSNNQLVEIQILEEKICKESRAIKKNCSEKVNKNN